ncbi:hypothetical protein HanIR_Chr08g0372041 [Helianthus annuus]|nr:hypothetical protein HanIR_Chr08g0372041 [Helianthus annuus]
MPSGPTNYFDYENVLNQQFYSLATCSCVLYYIHQIKTHGLFNGSLGANLTTHFYYLLHVYMFFYQHKVIF